MDWHDLRFRLNNKQRVDFYKDWKKHRWHFAVNGVRNGTSFTNKEGLAIIKFMQILDALRDTSSSLPT